MRGRCRRGCGTKPDHDYIAPMNQRPARCPPRSTPPLDLLAAADYLADRSLATVLFLALKMGRPLFLEGEAGVGKTEIAKVLSSTLGRRLIRLQCYEGLDVAAAVYEWNYAAQMIAIRVAEAEGAHDRERLEHDVFSERFLIKRPLLQALEPDPAGAPVLLIDELDRADEAFEAFLLEVLADFQVTIPELGTVKAAHPPIVVITSNRTREIHDALKRRCLYHWVGYPDAARELAIVRAKVPGIGKALSEQVVHFVQALRKEDLFKAPGVAETLDWAAALAELDVVALDPATVSDTLGVLLKYQDDIARLEGSKAKELIDEVRAGAARGGVAAFLAFRAGARDARGRRAAISASRHPDESRQARNDCVRDQVPIAGPAVSLRSPTTANAAMIGRYVRAWRKLADARVRQRSEQHLRERLERDRGNEQRQRSARSADRRRPVPA